MLLARAAEWLLHGHEPHCALAGVTRSGDIVEEEAACTCGAGREASCAGEALGRGTAEAADGLALELDRLLQF